MAVHALPEMNQPTFNYNPHSLFFFSFYPFFFFFIYKRSDPAKGKNRIPFLFIGYSLSIFPPLCFTYATCIHPTPQSEKHTFFSLVEYIDVLESKGEGGEEICHKKVSFES